MKKKQFVPFEVALQQCKKGCCHQASIVWAEGQPTVFLSMADNTIRLPGVKDAIRKLCQAIAEGLSKEIVDHMEAEGQNVSCKVVTLKPHEMN